MNAAFSEAGVEALNVAVHDTPVGLVAVLPPHDCGATGCLYPYTRPEPDAVLAVVTKCEQCDGRGWNPWPNGAGDDTTGCAYCDCTGYAPPRFVRVLEVWPIVATYEESVALCQREVSHVWIDGGDVLVVRITPLAKPGGVILIPDAEPGGVALLVEWCDCPTCVGAEIVNGRYDRRDGHVLGDPCPTCQSPLAPDGDKT